MAKIVYGVSGEGSGHSSRARVMAKHLIKNGHSVKIVSYDRGVKNLQDEFDVFETEGLHIASADNRVSKVKTFTRNLKKLSSGHRKLIELKEDIFKGFQPDCVLTDFEPMTAHLASHYRIPLISIDNQHRLRYMHFPCPERLEADRILTKNIIRSMIPKPDVSLVTTFHFNEITNDRTFSFPPILRKEVTDRTPVTCDHILVYLSFGFDTFLPIMKSLTREKFIVYGYDKSQEDQNLIYKPFSKEGFLKDLASAKAVMATAGFTLMTESFYYRKPFMALPMKGQFEQEINGILMAELGYGKNLSATTMDAVGDFLYHLQDYRLKLAQYPVENNSKIKQKMDELLEDRCALLKKFQARRRR
jgi:uncharacterized protein (TIGR00661 family)